MGTGVADKPHKLRSLYSSQQPREPGGQGATSQARLLQALAQLPSLPKGKLTGLQEGKRDHLPPPPKVGTNPSFPLEEARNLGGWEEDPPGRDLLKASRSSQRREVKRSLLSSPHWPAQSHTRPPQGSLTPQTSSAQDRRRRPHPPHHGRAWGLIPRGARRPPVRAQLD